MNNKLLQHLPVHRRIHIKMMARQKRYRWRRIERLITKAQRLCDHSFTAIMDKKDGSHYSVCTICTAIVED